MTLMFLSRAWRGYGRQSLKTWKRLVTTDEKLAKKRWKLNKIVLSYGNDLLNTVYGWDKICCKKQTFQSFGWVFQTSEIYRGQKRVHTICKNTKGSRALGASFWLPPWLELALFYIRMVFNQKKLLCIIDLRHWVVIVDAVVLWKIMAVRSANYTWNS